MRTVFRATWGIEALGAQRCLCPPFLEASLWVAGDLWLLIAQCVLTNWMCVSKAMWSYCPGSQFEWLPQIPVCEPWIKSHEEGLHLWLEAQRLCLLLLKFYLYLCLCLSLSNTYISNTYKLTVYEIYCKFISISNISNTYKLCLYRHWYWHPYVCIYLAVDAELY